MGGRAGVVGVLCALVSLLCACGAPEYTYVTNSDDRTYLKVPSTWAPLDERSIAQAFGIDPTLPENQQGAWFAGYDADAAPSLSHLLGPTSESPAVFVGVQDVPERIRGQVSLDLLRDFAFPVSPAAREGAAGNPLQQLSGFGLMADEVLTPGEGLRGVHVVYQYRLQGGPTQVFDQTAYVNDDASKIYMFFVRCSRTCFEDRQREIGVVVSSFTVRTGP